ncbi:MAG: DUF4416 family protein [Candidatus Sumerlaeaceae bacterium]|nr:DUF4416 family protein [Candidatus Sumerlaeaceae bacterium]
MGVERQHPMVKLFFGLIATDEAWLEQARARIAYDFSPISKFSKVLPFDQTTYYEKEMGIGLVRQWIAVKSLVCPEQLVEIKRYTNRLERHFSEDGNRRVNFDPGYVSLSKVVLATTKDHAHRLYVGKGIYEEVTLHFRRGVGFVDWPWTYPDYRTDEARQFFLEVREELLQQSQEMKNSN